MIQITDKLWIKSNGRCYIIGRPYVRRSNGKESISFRNPKYASTIAQAVKIATEQAMRDAVKNNTVTTLEGFARKYEELTSDFFQRLEAVNH